LAAREAGSGSSGLEIVTNAGGTLSLSDSNCHPKYIRNTHAGPTTATLAAGQSAALGRYWIIRQVGAGAVTIDDEDSDSGAVVLNGDEVSAGQHTTLAVILAADGVLDIEGGVEP
jgi:hypothetical protein